MSPTTPETQTEPLIDNSANRPVEFLLVEDDQAHAELIMLTLQDNGVLNGVNHVRDGAEALAFLRREGEHANAPRPDVVLLDLMLPKLNGHEVLAEIKSDENLMSIPVVILTTSENEIDRAQAYQGHANSYLSKPVNFERFQNMVKDLNLYWTVWNHPPTP